MFDQIFTNLILIDHNNKNYDQKAPLKSKEMCISGYMNFKTNFACHLN